MEAAPTAPRRKRIALLGSGQSTWMCAGRFRIQAKEPGAARGMSRQGGVKDYASQGTDAGNGMGALGMCGQGSCHPWRLVLLGLA
ncbi:hypothetical protein CKO08_12625 [Halorhodospira halochloris]|nr:hypothetical protein [Halorhodospira halochloris]